MKPSTSAIAGLALLFWFVPARAENEATRLYVTPFGFFDTSGEPRDQKAEHAGRLATMARELGSDLERKGLFRIVPPQADAPSCPDGDTVCILSRARQAGAALVLAGAVQKVSTMASSIWVGAFDAASGKRLFYRQLTFRGDTDEAWRHATSFLTQEIEDDPPKPP